MATGHPTPMPAASPTAKDAAEDVAAAPKAAWFTPGRVTLVAMLVLCGLVLTSRLNEAISQAEAHGAMAMALIEQGALHPQKLIERTIGLDEAAALLPVFDTATVAGMTMIDPAL